MDVKALAKSKRSHTQHHSKKSHHSHKPKAQSSSSSDPKDPAKNPPGKQQVNEEKKKKSHRSVLPSNWDRYGEEEDDSTPEIASKTLDVVLPKSKGADYRHLVAEAQSHAETSLEGFPAFDDLLLGEFGVGLSSMLASRGEGIILWNGDDNFVVEDKTSGNQEASFLSLNLLALADNFAKVDLSKRLFIESDLLSTELCAEELAVNSNEEHKELETKEDNELANSMSKEFNLDNRAADQFAPSSSSSSSPASSTFPLSNDFNIPVNSVIAEFQQASSSGKHKAFVLSSDSSLHSTEHMRGKQYSTFEAAAAEKELDMLLDSPVSLGVSSGYPPQILKKDPVSSKIASITASLDDALDDLLEETSTVIKPNVLLLPQEEKPVNHSMKSSSHPGSKSKVTDDFDSWFDTL
ncbi:hypothetical protein PHAVU_010G089800 [Phaseolus vulgaris]|uniref:Uncharacterized protein n=1 Tax=Phaseolus vulgaris TaxID=3885 RepID=V7ANR0_PHAVU|nr:hypothetical protein PHAVU_010G089800g [Phaseolus vulgaris]ESW06950.1 hypothetical protein PHAVU_010G089800g [Phaseolus vulgaris]